MRRLLLLVSAIMLVDTTFFAALTPLLPHYADTLGLTKAGAGVLTAAFGVGTLVGALPAGAFAARFGPKPAILVGLALLASTSLAFGFASSIWILDAARFCQGFGGACTWTGALTWLVAAAPSERRGEVIGTAVGAGVGGALLGPVLGGAAATFGTRPAFTAVAAFAVAIAFAAAVRPSVRPPEAQTLAAAVPRLRDPRLLRGTWLVALAATLFGTLSVLAPLRLDELGFGAAAIGAAFLVSAGAEALLSPLLGRLSDRRGAAHVVRFAVLASAAVSLALPWARDAWLLATLVVAAGLTYGAFWVPAMSSLSEGAEEIGLDQSFAFAFMNLAWATGEGAGSLVGGAVGQHAGDVVPYAFGAALCVATLLALGLTRRASEAYPEPT